MSKDKRRNRINGQFSPRLIEMLESPAYRALSKSGHRIISRIEIELGRHGGNDNGKLPLTFEDFIEYGVDRAAVAPAIREVDALGFARVTEHGRGGNREYRRPNLFFLTFGRGRVNGGDLPTDDWRKIKTLKEALNIARAARAAKDPHAVARGRRHAERRAQQQKTDGGKNQVQSETNIETAKPSMRESRTTVSSEKPTRLSISGNGEPSDNDLTDECSSLTDRTSGVRS